MLTTLTAPAFAETWDIEKGDITVKAGKTEGTNMVSQGEQKDVEDTGTVITGKSDKNTVTIEAEKEDDKVEVTLKDLNIDASRGSEAAVSVTGKGNTNIELDGDNELKGGSNRAGLEHNQTVDGEGNVTSGKLTIQDENNDGSLNATGKGFAAGIGGGSVKAGQVTITGGTITATGEDGAGIGGGQGNKGTNAGNADIEISGGTIEATGGYASAGIGGGTWGDANIKITGDAVIKNATGGVYGSGIGGGGGGNGDVTISGNAKIENAQGGITGSGIGGGNGASGTVVIKDDSTVTATGGEAGAGIGGGYAGLGDVTIEGNTMVNATGGVGSAGVGGGYGAKNDEGGNGSQITIKSNESGAPNVTATGGESSIDEETKEKIPGGAGIGSGVGDAKANITLEGKVTIVAKGGEGNAAIGDMNGEQEFSGLAEGSSITRYDSEGNNITLPTDPVPAVPSSSGGGSADATVQESVFPGLVVTDKDGQRISYTSIRGNNVLSLRVGRFTASLRASLATLRQLRAEGIDTITFQTILCSTTLSVDELLAMGGEDAEAVLTHRLTASSLTVG
ncbi:hypothetical protein [Faecalibacterium sp.]|uniref:hypothetical protein n=1 Tax=Faecalibacterium sp. TaxID=1971605 RepID=UPI00399B6764